MPLGSLGVLEAVVPRETDREEDDEQQHQDDKQNDDLHLHVLPPHLAPQLAPSLLEFHRLRRDNTHVLRTMVKQHGQ